MSAVIFAVAASVEAAELLTHELTRELSQGAAPRGNINVHVHPRGRIDLSALPEAATHVSRNTWRAAGVGGALGVTIGIGVGWTDRLLGLDVAAGGGLGLVAGVLVGALCGVMAGTRQPKQALHEVATQMGPEDVLVTIEVGNDDEQTRVDSVLAHAHVRVHGAC